MEHQELNVECLDIDLGQKKQENSGFILEAQSEGAYAEPNRPTVGVSVSRNMFFTDSVFLCWCRLINST